MAHTAHKKEDEVRELFDDPDVLHAKVKQLAHWIRESNRTVAFTGAGISTSAGIPDYRGPQGVWTLRAQGKTPVYGVDCQVALPTYCHMSLVALQARKLLHHLISQNVDGLHRRSGFPPTDLSELHGNSNTERCEKCEKEYLRDFDTVNCTTLPDGSGFDHRTGRLCEDPRCRGALVDTIVNFGENLPRKVLSRAIGGDESQAADLHIVLGSSLRVSPACDLPRMTSEKPGGRLVICNLQKTPLDGRAALVIHARVDEMLQLLMQELGLTPPPFILRRRAILECTHMPDKRCHLAISGLDVDGTPFAFIKSAEIVQPTRGATTKHAARAGAVVFDAAHDSKTQLKFQFQGHYGEPDLTLDFPLDEHTPAQLVMLLEYGVTGDRSWTVSPWDEPFSKLAASVGRLNLSAVGAAAAGSDIPHEPTDEAPGRGSGRTIIEVSFRPDARARSQPAFATGRGYAVEPKRDCPHVTQAGCLCGVPTAGIDCATPCTDCGDATENWICLTCYTYHCSRYVHGHMAAHNEHSGHLLALSMSDLSVWCYACDAYITHHSLREAIERAHVAKFG